MHIFLLMLIFPFSLFLLIASYWKEDKILHFLGSIGLMLTAILLFTGVQMSYAVPDGAGDVVAGSFNAVSVQEGYGIGILLFVLTITQMIYFGAVFEFDKRRSA